MASSIRNHPSYVTKPIQNLVNVEDEVIAAVGQDAMHAAFRVRTAPDANADDLPMPVYRAGVRRSSLLSIQSSRWLPELPTAKRMYRVVKRVMDISITILLLPVISALLLLIGLLVGLTSGWPLFYRQTRIGQHGREFRIWKFRTMKVHGDEVLADHLSVSPTARREWQHTHKLRDDPRITLLGRFLRKSSLDELPQIFNVLAGEMSLVGPRPIVNAEAERYAERFTYYMAALPGITGLWQVSGRCDVSYVARVKMDEEYVRNWTLAQDLRIMAKTPKAVFRRDGAY